MKFKYRIRKKNECFKKSLFLFRVCFILCIAFHMQPLYIMAAENENPKTENPKTENPVSAVSPSIAGEAGIIMEVSTGTILYEKNMHDIHFPASITKIMTALLAIENCELDEMVTVPHEAVYMEDKGTHIALEEGEQLTVEQCLYAVMLASANDAAYALAEHVGGTYDNFILMMNEKAKEIGCQNTNFTNPHGLPDENHVTSAYDMALITIEALQYEIFQTISGTSYYEIPPAKNQKDLICMYNHHKMIGKTQFQNKEVIAGKNGYTDAAGHTLVTCAKRDDMVIVCVVMKELGEFVYPDTVELLNYGLDSFTMAEIRENKTYLERMQKKENSLEGQTDSVVDGIAQEGNGMEDSVEEPLSEKKEDEGGSSDRKHTIFAICAGIMTAVVFLLMLSRKCRRRNKRSKPGRKSNRKRRKRRPL